MNSAKTSHPSGGNSPIKNGSAGAGASVKRMANKTVSMLIAVLMVVTLLPTSGLSALAGADIQEAYAAPQQTAPDIAPALTAPDVVAPALAATPAVEALQAPQQQPALAVAPELATASAASALVASPAAEALAAPQVQASQIGVPTRLLAPGPGEAEVDSWAAFKAAWIDANISKITLIGDVVRTGTTAADNLSNSTANQLSRNLEITSAVGSTYTINFGTVTGDTSTMRLAARTSAYPTTLKLNNVNIVRAGTGVDSAAVYSNVSAANSEGWTVQLNNVSSVGTPVSPLVYFANYSANLSLSGNINWQPSALSQNVIRAGSLDIADDSIVNLENNNASTVLVRGNHATIGKRAQVNVTSSSTEATFFLQGISATTATVANPTTFTMLDDSNVHILNNTTGNNWSGYGLRVMGSGDSRVAAAGTSGVIKVQITNRAHLLAETHSYGVESGGIGMGGSTGSTIKIDGGAYVEAKSSGTRNGPAWYHVVQGTAANPTVLDISGSGTKVEMSQTGTQRNSDYSEYNAVFRMPYIGGQQLKVSDQAEVLIYNFALSSLGGYGGAGIRFGIGENNSLVVNSGGHLRVENWGNGTPTYNLGVGGNDAVEVDSNNFDFQLSGDKSTIELIGHNGPVFATDNSNAHIDIGPGTIFEADGRTPNNNQPIFASGANFRFTSDNPLYYDFTNKRPGGGRVFAVGANSTFTSVNSDVSVWRSGINTWSGNPDKDFMEINYKLQGAAAWTLANDPWTVPPSGTASYTTDTGFRTYYNQSGTTYHLENYTRISGNNAKPVITSKQATYNTDKYVRWQGLVPEGRAITDRAFWDGEIRATVEITPAGGAPYTTTANIMSVNDDPIYDEQTGVGILRGTLRWSDGTFLKAGDTYKLLEIWRGDYTVTPPKLRYGSQTATELAAFSITVEDATPPKPAADGFLMTSWKALSGAWELDPAVQADNPPVVAHAAINGTTITGAGGAPLEGTLVNNGTSGTWSFNFADATNLAGRAGLVGGQLFKDGDIVSIILIDAFGNANPIAATPTHDKLLSRAAIYTAKDSDIAVTKNFVGSKDFNFNVGDKLSWTIKVSNVGAANGRPTTSLNNVVVSDDLTGGAFAGVGAAVSFSSNLGAPLPTVTRDGDDVKINTIRPNEEITLTYEYTVKATDIGETYVNTVTVLDDNQDTDSATDSAGVRITNISATKTSSQTSILYGQKAIWDVSVTNDSKTASITSVTLADSIAGLFTALTIDGVPQSITPANPLVIPTLTPGQVAVATFEHTVAAFNPADPYVYNSVLVTDAQGDKVTASDSTGIDILLSYKVNYVKQGTTTALQNGIDPSPKTVNNQVANSVVTEKAITIPGYTVVAPNEQKMTLDADSKELTFAYTANTTTKYTVQHYLQNPDGTYPGVPHESVEHLDGTTDEIVYTFDKKKTYAGYTYDGVQSDSFGTIAGDGSLVLKAYYTANTNNQYKVEYYRVDGLPGSYVETLFEPATTVSPATTGANAVAPVRTFTGYTLDETYPGTVNNVPVAGDGSTILKIYYKARIDVSYTVHYYKTGTTTALAPSVTRNNMIFNQTYKEDALGIVGYKLVNPAHIEQYITLNALDKELIFYYTEDSGVSWTTRHWKVDATSAADPTPIYNEDLPAVSATGTTGDVVNAIVKSFTGYTYQPTYDVGARKTVASGTILADGSLELNLYYTAQTTVSYKVNYLQQTSGTILAPQKTVSGQTFNTSVTEDAIAIAGYTVVAPPSQTFTIDSLTKEITFYYTANTDTAFKVEHYKVDGVGAPTLADTDDRTGTSGTTVSGTPKTYAGYTYDSLYSGTVNNVPLAGDGTTVLKLFYISNNNTAYKVEHYRVDGTTPTLVLPIENLAGTTGSVVSATPRPPTGYTYSEFYPGSVKSGTILGDGSLVLKLFYTAKSDANYKINYLLEGTTTALATPKVVTGQVFNSLVTENAIAITGYTPVAPTSLTFNLDAYSIERTFYYVSNTGTPYKIEHYFVDGAGNATLQSALTDYLGGLTGGSANANPYIKTVVGYTYDYTDARNLITDTIKADGSTTLKVHYKANTNVSYTVRYISDTTGTEITLAPPKSVYNQTFNSIVSEAAASVVGYTVVPPATQNVVLDAYDKAITFKYTPNDATPFKIQHFTVSAGVVTEQLPEDALYGVTGTHVNAIPDKVRSFPGYELNTGYTGSLTEADILADGSLILKLYYTARTDLSYKVNYLLDTTTTALATQKVVSGRTFMSAIYETAVPVTGYTVVGSGVITDSLDSLTKEVTFYYTANTNTAYTVQHYKVDSGVATLIDTETLAGTTGNTVYATPKTTVTGYSYDSTYAGTLSSGVVAANGSLVLKLYYSAKTDATYKVNYLQSGSGTILAPQAAVGGQVFGSTVSVNSIAIAGYTVVPPATQSLTLDAYDKEVTFYYTANTNTAYTVEHYKVDGGVATLQSGDTQNLSGTSGTSVTATPLAYAGYTYTAGYSGSVPSGIIAGDGSLTLKLYYVASSDTTYKVEHWFVGDSTAHETETLTGTTGTTATAASKVFVGYTYDSTNASNIKTGTILGDNSLVLKLYYTANTDANYKVNYLHLGSGTILATQKSVGGQTFNSSITEYATTIAGYTVVAPDSQTFTLDAYNKEITFYYTANASTAYKVEHWFVGESTAHEIETLSGTTGTSITATPKTYTGYTYDFANAGNIPNGTIAGNGSLVLKLYYSAKTDVSYKVNYLLDGTTTVLSPQKTVSGETFGTTVNEPSIAITGYAVVPPAVQSLTLDAYGKELTFYYTYKTDTVYKIEHFQVDSGTAHLHSTTTEYGTTNASVTADGISIFGYEVDYAYTGTIRTGVISADGTLMLRLFYPAKSDVDYKVNYLLSGTLDVLAPQKVVENQTFNTTVGEAAITIAGYTPLAPISSTMVLDDYGKEFNFYYTYGTSTAYTVEHYKVDAGVPTLVDTENLSGTTGNTASASVKTYTGYSYDSAYDDGAGNVTVASGTIAADGSLVLKLYYTAKTDANYKVNYLQQGSGTVLAPAKYVSGQTFNAVFTEYAPAIAGYTVVAPDTQTFNLDAYNKEITFEYSANTDTAYTVEHYLVTGGVAALDTTEHLSGTSGTLVYATSKTYAGYTYSASYTGSVISGIVAGDGSLILKLYYTANTDTSYKVEHWFVGESTAHEIESLTGVTGATANAVAKTYVGYTYDSGNAANIKTGTILGDNSLILKLFYTANTDATYKVNYRQQTTEAVLAPQKSVNGQTFNSSITEDAIDITGYDKVAPISRTFTLDAYDKEITFYYTAGTSTAYTVEHYRVDGGVATRIDADTEYLSGVTGALVNATVKTSYTGYTYDGTDVRNITNGNIKADGSLTLKLYYKANTNVAYTVRYISDTTGTEITLAPVKSVYNQVFNSTAHETAASVVGYTVIAPATQDVLLDAYDKVITFKYTPNDATPFKTEHYTVDAVNGTVLKDTIANYGITGTTVTAVPRFYIGYELNTAYPGTLESSAIAADGTLVLKLYYTARTDLSYKVNYLLDATTTPLATPKIVSSKTYLSAILEASIAITGYTVVGTGVISDTLDSLTKEVSFYYTANTNTAYTVQHFKVDSGVATLVDTETLSGTTGITAFATPKSTIVGYAYDSTYAGTLSSGTIAANGSLVLKLYYSAKSDVSYKVNYRLRTTEAVIAPQATVSGATFGTTVTVSAIAIAGYTVFPPATQNLSLNAYDKEITFYYTANTNTAYTVEHYKVDGGVATLQSGDTQNLTGTTGTTVFAVPKSTYAGYTYTETYTGSVPSGTVAGDGSLVLRLYYVANSDTTYTVEHWFVGGTSAHQSDIWTGTTGTTAVATPKTYTGYTYDDANVENVKNGTILGDNSLVLKLFYSANTDVSYRVNYRAQFTEAVLAPQKTVSGATFDSTVTVDAVAIAGYTVVGSTTDTLVLDAYSKEYTFYYTANSDTAYSVEHWFVGESTAHEIESLAGTTNTTVSAVPKTYTGYTYDYANAANIPNGTISGDGTLTLKLYYSAKSDVSYKVNFLLDGTTTVLAPQRTVGAQTFNTTVSVLAAAITGYTVVPPASQSLTLDTYGKEVNFYYTAATDTVYKVEHFQVDAGSAHLHSTTTESGTTDEVATAVARTDIFGYTVDLTYTGTIEDGIIAADGTLVLRLFYPANTDVDYKVNYLLTGTTTALAPQKVVDNQTFNTTVGEAAITIAGYTPLAPISSTMVLDDYGKEFNFYYTYGTSTAYTVEHYKVDSGVPTLVDTENLSGTTGNTVNASVKTYTGYTYDSAYDDGAGNVTVASGIIAADGSLVLKLYYIAKTDANYKVNYLEQGSGTILATAKTVTGQTFNATFTEYAATIAGYTVVPPDTQTFNLDAYNKEITFEYSANTDTAYTVKHYKVDGGVATVADTEHLSGTSGTTVYATPKTYAGYAYNSTYSGTRSSGVVAGDGSLVLELYYTANSDTGYKIEHWFAGDSTAHEIETLTGVTGTTISAAPKSYIGYTYDGANAANIKTGIIAGDGSLVLKLYYSANTDATYKVNYRQLATEAVLAPQKVVTGQIFNSSITEDAIDITGYVKVAPISRTFVLDAYDKEITFYYTAGASTAYTVEHYRVDGGVATLIDADTEHLSGTTGALVNAIAKTSYTGYTYDGTDARNITNGTVAANGSLTLKLYYKANTNVSYTVRYISDTTGSEIVLAPTKSVFDQTFNTVASETALSVIGYTVIAPATQDVVLDAYNKVITFKYTPNDATPFKTEHYTVDAAGATLRDTVANYGITGTTVTAVPKTYTGYELNTAYPGTLESSAIAADGKLVLKLYYSARTDLSYKVNYLLEGTTTALSTQKVVSSKTFMSPVLEAAIYITGYTVVGSGAIIDTLDSLDKEVTFYYTANANTAYTVQHFKVDGAAATLVDTETLSGTTGITAFATPKTYTGYVYDSGYAGSQASGVIAADGSMVLKLYYSAKSDVSYKVNYRLVATDAVLAPQKIVSGATFNTTVSESAIAIAGYSAIAPSTQNLTLNAYDKAITFYYTANTNTAYTVEHYKVDAGLVTLQGADTQSLTGTTGTTVYGTPKSSYVGYTYNSSYSGSVLSGTVAGDGSLVLKLYYVADSDSAYTVEHWFVGGSAAHESEALSGVVGTVVKAAPKTYTGYSYDDANTANVKSGTIASDGSLTLKLYYSANTDVAYKVNYREQSTETALAAQKTVSGATFDSTATVDAISISGYTVVGTGTDTLVLDAYGKEYTFYYTASDTTSYKVEHRIVGDSGVYDTDTLSGTTGATATAVPKSYTGYSYDYANVANVTSGTIAGDGTLVLKLYYIAKSDVSYKVNYLLDATTTPLAAQRTVTGATFGTTANVSAAAIAGYTVVPPAIQTLTLDAYGKELTFYYTPSTDTVYKVEHFQVDAGSAHLHSTTEEHGTTGDVATAVARTDIFGYTVDLTYTGTIEDGIIAADGTLVLRLFYPANTDVDYKVNYFLTGTTTELAPQKVVDTQTFNTTVAESAIAIAGYSALAPTSLTLTLDDYGKEITFYYTYGTSTAYTVEHYKVDGAGVPTRVDADTESRTGTTGNTVSATPKSYIGYTYGDTYDDGAGNATVASGTIAADGSLVLTLYYTANTDANYKVNYVKQGTTTAIYTAKIVTGQEFNATFTEYAETVPGYEVVPPDSQTFILDAYNKEIYFEYTTNTDTAYTVEHYKVDAAGVATRVDADTENLTGTTGDLVSATPNTYLGYTFDYSYPGTVASGTIAGDGSLTLKLYYTTSTSVSYTVYYISDSTGLDIATPKTVGGQEFDSTVTETALAVPGYTVILPDTQSLKLDDFGLSITFSYTENTDTAYRVEHYKVDGTGTAVLTDFENLTGTTDATVSATPRTDYAKYSFDASYPGTLVSDTIKGDGSTVLKLYYTYNDLTHSKVYTGPVTDVEEGDIVPWLITVTNSGSGTATNIAVVELNTTAIFGNVQINGADATFGTDYTIDFPTLTMTIFSIAPGSTVTIQLTTEATAAELATGGLENQYSVDGDGGGGTGGEQANLTSTKVYTGPVTNVKANDSAPWLITITNSGAGEAKDIAVIENNTTATFGAVTVNDVAISEGTDYTVNASTRTMVVKSIPAGAVVKIIVNTRVSDAEITAGALGNNAKIDGHDVTGGGGELAELDSTKVYTGSLYTSDLSAGDDIPWLITITNNGSGAATDVPVIESNATAIFGTVSTTAYTRISDTELVIHSIPAGTSVAIAVTTKVTASELTAGVVANQVTIDGKTITGGGGDLSKLVTTKDYVGDPTIGVNVGDTVHWLVTVTNEGGKTEAATVTDLRAGGNFLLPSVTSNKTGNVVSYTANADGSLTFASITKDEKISVTYEYTIIDSDAGSALGNSVDVNGKTTTTTDDPPVSGLNTTKTFNGDTSIDVKVGDTVTWDIVVANNGLVNESANISEAFRPSGQFTTITSSTGSAVYYLADPTRNTIDIPTIVPGEVITLVFEYQVLTTDAGADLTNTVNVNTKDITTTDDPDVEPITTINLNNLTVQDVSKTYGEADPAFSVTGWLPAFDPYFTLSFNREAGEDVSGGHLYEITATVTPTGVIGPFDIIVGSSIVPGNLTIDKRDLTATVTDYTVFVYDTGADYDAKVPSPQFVYDNFAFGEDATTAAYFTAGTITKAYTPGASPAGLYEIALSAGSAPNYNVPAAKGTLTVISRTAVAPVINTIYERDNIISGTGIAGSTVTVIFPGTYIDPVTGSLMPYINYAVVAADGTWSAAVVGVILNTNDFVSAYQQSPGLGQSDTTTSVVLRRAPLAPYINPIHEGDTTITGLGEWRLDPANPNDPSTFGKESGAIVTVTFPGTTTTATAVVSSDGRWVAALPSTVTLTAGDLISATQKQAYDPDNSLATQTPVLDYRVYQPPQTPINAIYVGDNSISGQGVPGATVTVTIITAPGTQQVITTVNASGQWVVPVPAGVVLAVGENVGATQTVPVPANYEAVIPSAPYWAAVQILTSQPPSIDEITENDRNISGSGIAGATVTVYFDNNTVASTTVDASGRWSVSVPASVKLVAGLAVTATQTQPNRNTSQPVSQGVNAIPVTPPTPPTPDTPDVNVVVNVPPQPVAPAPAPTTNVVYSPAAAPTPAPVTVAQAVPTETAPAPTTNLNDGATPLAGGSYAALALVNLILALIGLLGALGRGIYLAARSSKRSGLNQTDLAYFATLSPQEQQAYIERQEEADNAKKRSTIAFRVFGFILAVAGVIAFILTENLNAPLALVDNWTVLMVSLLISEIVAFAADHFLAKTKEEDNRRLNIQAT